MHADNPDFGKDELERYLKRAWLDRGYQIPESGRFGVRIAELVEHSTKHNLQRNNRHFELWLAVLDEFLSWEVSLITIFYGEIKKRGEMSYFDKSATLTLSKIVADTTAIRHLIIAGFDTSARAILRSVAEYMEVWVAFLHDPEFTKPFWEADTPEKAKRFWENYLRGRKIRHRVRAAWKDFFHSHSSDSADWLAHWGANDHLMLSGLSHPSSAGGLFTVIPLKASYDDESWLGIWGDKSEASVQTVYTYAKFMLPMLLLGNDFPFDHEVSGGPDLISFDAADELHQHVRGGRSVLASLILSLSSESNAKYVFPDVDYSIWTRGD